MAAGTLLEGASEQEGKQIMDSRGEWAFGGKHMKAACFLEMYKN